ncbi:hypothetical protein HY570_02855 [Candidatus Micrarchaeota archaeon]|nr:hypothetical protein [Candidatus Micrarchaeota archaeon]
MLDTIQEIKPNNKDSISLATGAWAIALIPFLGLIANLIIFFTSKEDKFVRLHSIQAFLADLFFVILSVTALLFLIIPFFLLPFIALQIPVLFILFPIVPFLILGIMLIIFLAKVLVYLYSGFRAYKGEAFLLPVLGRIAVKFF